MDLVDSSVISLQSSPNGGVAQDASHGIQRRLDEVVDVPCFVAILSWGESEVDADAKPADQGKLSQQGGSNCFGDGRLPACLTCGRIRGWTCRDVKGDPSPLLGVARLGLGHRLGGRVGRRRWSDDVAREGISVDL